jgi:hypothetical protein
VSVPSGQGYKSTWLKVNNSGGSVLATLKSSQHENIQNAQIDVLIRGEERGALFDSFGVQVIPFQSLDETDLIRKLSSDYDGIDTS